MYIDILEFVQNANELIFQKSGSCNIDNFDSQIELLDEVKYNLMISKVDSELILNIDLDYSYACPCDRCLTRVENDQSFSYSAKIINSSDFNEEELSENEDLVFVDSYKLDICNLVRELVILSIPTKNLCKDSCQGICPQCGKNLNEGTCNCNNENTDLRFAVLKDFKFDEEV